MLFKPVPTNVITALRILALTTVILAPVAVTRGDVIAPTKPLSFAFCSDTCYKPNIISIIENVDLLYHEATFLADREDLAKKTKHSTSKQAAQIAKDASVKQLILGHYSGRYKDISLFKTEAKKIFENTELAEPGKVFSIH